MLQRKDLHKAGRQALTFHPELIALLLLFCGIGAITSCSPFATASSTPSVQSRPQPTLAVPQPFHSTLRTTDGDFSLTLDITPNHSGPNVFALSILNRRTKKAAQSIKVVVYTTMQDMAMGTDSLVLRAIGKGQFRGTSDILNMDGHWAVGITIQTSDHSIHKAGVSLQVAT